MHMRKHHRSNYLIGTKTSRNAKAAALDKHVLKFYKKYWHPVCKLLLLLYLALMQDLFTLGIIKCSPFPLQVIIY